MTKPQAYETEVIDKLFLELSQVTQATTAKELALRARQAVLVEALTPAFKAIDAISADPNDMQRRRDAEVNCFYAVQRARAALAQEKQGGGKMSHVTTCSTCHKLYEECSEEHANAPDRKCRECF